MNLMGREPYHLRRVVNEKVAVWQTRYAYLPLPAVCEPLAHRTVR